MAKAIKIGDSLLRLTGFAVDRDPNQAFIRMSVTTDSQDAQVRFNMIAGFASQVSSDSDPASWNFLKDASRDQIMVKVYEGLKALDGLFQSYKENSPVLPDGQPAARDEQSIESSRTFFMALSETMLSSLIFDILSWRISKDPSDEILLVDR